MHIVIEEIQDLYPEVTKDMCSIEKGYSFDDSKHNPPSRQDDFDDGFGDDDDFDLPEPTPRPSPTPAPAPAPAPAPVFDDDDFDDDGWDFLA